MAINDLLIRPVTVEELDRCAHVVRESFMTVAGDFGITVENCPTNPAFITTDRLTAEMQKGNLLYGFFENGELIGFFLLEQKAAELFYLERLAVLPGYRHKGYGAQILRFAKESVREKGGSMLSIGIIEENAILKDWYIRNVFVPTGTRKFEHLPFTVGFLECAL